MSMTNVWAVVPAYNEERSIRETIVKIGNHVSNIVVVDDGSTDGTYEAAVSTGAHVLRHLLNLGKGAALKTGCDYAVSSGAQLLVVLDADAQHDPDEIPLFLEKLGGCDIVFGYRKLSGKMPLILRLGNWGISLIISVLYGMSMRDSQSGYRAFSSEAYSKIRWEASDYSMESEMIAKTGRNKLKYTQVPIKTIYSDKYKGTTIIDGIKIVTNMLWWRLFNSHR